MDNEVRNIICKLDWVSKTTGGKDMIFEKGEVYCCSYQPFMGGGVEDSWSVVKATVWKSDKCGVRNSVWFTQTMFDDVFISRQEWREEKIKDLLDEKN